MTWDEARAGMAAEAPTVKQLAQLAGGVPAALGAGAVGFWWGGGGFDSLAFRAYRRAFGVAWDREGDFQGRPLIEARGGREYTFAPDPLDPFRFVRATGEVVTPGRMRTDGGSVPRAAWVVPGVDPWVYMPAYLIHDWLFMSHHCCDGNPGSFAEANAVLAEGVYTLMMRGAAAADWRVCELIYRAVSSPFGWRVWSSPWSPDACAASLG